MWLEQADYSLSGVGENIDVNRFYNSQMQTSGMFGKGWTTKYDESLTILQNELALIKMPDGRTEILYRNDTTSPFNKSASNFDASLVQNPDTTYTLTFKDGRVHIFSSAGKLIAQRDRIGNQTTVNYDPNGNIASVVDTFGRTLTFTTNLGVVTQISDAFGVVANYAYNPDGTLQSVTYPDNSKYQFAYTQLNGRTLMTTVSDALGNVLESHQYDMGGRALTSVKQGGVESYTFNYDNVTSNPAYTTVTDGLGRISKYYFNKTGQRNLIDSSVGLCGCGGAGSEATSFKYDERQNVIEKTDALGRKIFYTYDANNNLTSVTDWAGTETFTYNQFGQVLTRTDKMNGVWTNVYDAQGKLLTSTDPLNAVTTLTYTPKGQVATVKDARNKVTTFTYDTSGRLSVAKDANLKNTTYTYDLRSRVATVKNALNFTTSFQYDGANRLTRVTYPDTKFEAYGYDLAGRRTSMTDQKGLITTYGYDGAYRLTAVTDPLNHTTQMGYDIMSNPTSRTDALGNTTTYQYDEFDRLKKVIYPVTDVGVPALEENYEYDLVGNLKRRIDTAGRPTVYDYDAVNRLIKVTDPNLQITQFGYNARSQMTAVQDALNQVYTFSYDPLGRQLSQTRAGTTMSYVYDAVGNRTQRTDYKGVVTNYVYDNLNRLTNIQYPNAAENITYAYDNISRTTSAVNYAGTVSFAYNNRNRLTSTTDVHGKVVAYTYDANGSRLTMKLDTVTEATYTYDNDNRLTRIRDGALLNTNYTYDIADRLLTKTLPNGVATTYQYDAMSRLRRLKDDKGTTNLYDRQYSYNTASNISQILEPTSTKNYGYDNLDRLTGVTGSATENYSYDNVGNRLSSQLSATYTYQANNRMASTATASFAYDSNGNMSSKTDASGATTYTWDYENRLRTVTKPGNLTVNYKYDALGRRSEQIYGNGFGTKFTYDGSDVILDTNSDATTVKYVNGLGIDDKLKMIAGTTVSYFVQDHQGSTVALTNPAGAITSSATYDTYGNSTGNLTTRYAYTGREYDSFTGLHYYRARYYDGNLGRFLTEDPIGLAGGINQFGYVNGNPLNFRDPSGKVPVIIPILIGAGILMLTSPSYVNAPGPGDQGYDSRSPIVGNAVIGAGGGFLASKLLGPAVSYFCKFGSRSGGAVTNEVIDEAAKGVFKSADDLPPVKDGFTRLFRGSGHPDIPQVSPSMRGVPGDKVPSGAENFLTPGEALLHKGSFHPDAVSASRTFSGASGYGTSKGSTIVYDVPNGVVNKLPTGEGALQEVIFKYSIPEIYRTGKIPR